jgi:DNA-binding transcriptional regulator YhcF (GntR family)
MKFCIDPGSDTPIYLQLTGAILAQIESGALGPGSKLPTVRALAAQTRLSPGTIRHAYDALARGGAIEMRQGKGTFVRAPEPGAQSRQKQAMQAIEALLDRMEALEFSPREVSMYLSLSLRQRGAARKLLPVAVVDCNPESVRQVALQLSHLSGVELSEYLLEDVRQAASVVLKDYPLVVTSQTHGHELSALMGERQEAIGKVVLSPGPETIMALSRVEADSGLGIYCQTQRFAQIVRNGLGMFPELHAAGAPVFLAGVEPLAGRLKDIEVLLVPPDFRSFAPREDLAALEAFEARGGQALKYLHQIDRGSMMYIEDRVRALTS